MPEHNRPLYELMTVQGTPLTDAVVGAKLSVVAKMLAPNPDRVPPGATLSQDCSA